MKSHPPRTAKQKKSHRPALLFPLSVLLLYALCTALAPDRAAQALRNSARIAWKLPGPLSAVFVAITLMNLFLTPGRIARFLGRDAGIRGIVCSALAGMLSMGPIYAWYPLLGDLRTRGAGYAPIAIFLCNRAGVKPFLLPVMISCFGWPYVLILTTLGIFGAFAIGCILSALMPESPPSLSE